MIRTKRNAPIYKQLEYKEIQHLKDYQKRVMFFNPTDIYKNTHIDQYKRNQQISIRDMFTNKKGICGCGCDAKLIGRQTRWATKECMQFAVDVFFIITGNIGSISFYIKKYYGEYCVICGTKNVGQQFKNGLIVNSLKLDHIIPVKHGGGGCWLNNYQFLCHTDHVEKTKKDFKWK
jgi:5-methylcytosine-specific restriction endonuclease McrA